MAELDRLCQGHTYPQKKMSTWFWNNDTNRQIVPRATYILKHTVVVYAIINRQWRSNAISDPQPYIAYQIPWEVKWPKFHCDEQSFDEPEECLGDSVFCTWALHARQNKRHFINFIPALNNYKRASCSANQCQNSCQWRNCVLPRHYIV